MRGWFTRRSTRWWEARGSDMPNSMDIQQFEGRKRDHLRKALDASNQASGMSGLDSIRLVHEALPELDFQDVRLDCSCLQRPARTPFYVSAMTAGHGDAFAVNYALARGCWERGWAMGVGSQRRELEDPSGPAVDDWKRIREEFPELPLFANIGLSQLITSPTESVGRLVAAISANALVVHANALQEALQPEGTPKFRGGLDAFARICSEVGVPVVLKETGCGFSKATLKRLRETGLAAIDVSGLGGTHWGRVEGARAPDGSLHSEAAATFASWGEPTAEVVENARKVHPELEIWASGGVRTGLDAAKLLALGADRVGYAQPALQAVLDGPERLASWMQLQEYELRVAMFCTGASSLRELRKRKLAEA